MNERGIGLPLIGGVLLAAATPPAVLPFGEWLVLPGLAVWFVVCRAPQRPGWHAYLLGCVHMAWFSWSVHHVLWFAWVAIVVLGGLYYLLVRLAVAGLPRPFAVPGFAVAVAASCWLRASVPDIHYPHGQPCHALWQWPELLRPVALGGEALANALCAALGATLARLAASWRSAAPPWRRACCGVAVVAASWGLAVVAARALSVPAPTAAPVDVALIEPGFHLARELGPLPREQRAAHHAQLIEQRLLAPTRALLAEPSPPVVVLWPESSVFDPFLREDIVAGRARVGSLARHLPAGATRLVLGANVDDGGLPTPAALLVELPSMRVLGHQEKRCLVPGGEFQPLFRWLPDSWATVVRGWFEAALLSLPDALPGRELPPLQVAGVPFGVLLCFDNAFAGPAADQVAAGARWLAVLSNESWYEGGGELTQLMAMTVLRALENATPVVRCTQDGWSGMVDASGRVADSLPIEPAPRPGPRILRVEVPPGAGAVPPLAWLRRGLGPATAIALIVMLLHAIVAWARLRAARTTSRPALPAGLSGGGQGSGS